MPLRSPGDVRMIILKAAADAGTSAEVTIPVQGSAGVNLGAIGCALGLEPSSVRLNGHFVSRGDGFVSSLQWDSLLSFFTARGLPAGASPFDSILVQGKPISRAGWSSSPDAEYVGHPGFKRKFTVNIAKPLKKSRLFESFSKEQNTGTEQVTDDEFISIKRRSKFNDDHPSKKGKVGECDSDCHSFRMKNEGHLCSSGLSIDQNFLSLQENHNDHFCKKRRLKLDEDHPFKKGKIDERNPGFCDEASRVPMVFSRTG